MRCISPPLSPAPPEPQNGGPDAGCPEADLLAALRAPVSTDPLDFDAPCRLLLSLCQQRCHLGQLAVLVYHPERRALAVGATLGLPAEATVLRFPCPESVLLRLLRAREPCPVRELSTDTVLSDQLTAHHLALLQDHRWAPLLSSDRLVGVLSFGPRLDGKPFRRGELEFVATLAPQIAAALAAARMCENNATARRRLDRSLCHLSMIFDITRALGAVSNLSKLLQLILERAIDAVEAERGSLMLLDESSGDLVLRVVFGLPDKALEQRINDGEVACRRFKRGEGVAGRVLETGSPIVIDDTGKDSSFTDRSGSSVRSILCVPLNVDGETIGVVNITNRKGDQPFQDEDREILCALADQAAVAIARARLYEAAVTDGLTGLYVRRFAFHRLADEIKRSRRYRTPLSVIMCDIDHFKAVNDTWGHLAGDAVLAAVGHLLKSGLRTDIDLTARYGGEEFLLILPETDAAGARVAAERLRKAVEELVVDDGVGRQLRVTMSLGIAELDPSDEELAEALLRRSDRALYESKLGGRNRVTVCQDRSISSSGAALPGVPDPLG